jgi:hypothetical protein
MATSRAGQAPEHPAALSFRPFEDYPSHPSRIFHTYAKDDPAY